MHREVKDSKREEDGEKKKKRGSLKRDAENDMT